MGTFFSSYPLKDLGMTSDDFYPFSKELLVPKNKTIIGHWFEFAKAIGYESKIYEGGNFFQIQSNREANRVRDIPEEIFNSFDIIYRKINNYFAMYLGFYFRELHDLENLVMEINIPSIDHEKLRDFGAKNFDKTELIGTFLVELKEELPEIVSELELSDRQAFEKGLEIYLNYQIDKADKRLIEAKEKSQKAKIIDAEANQITEEAHRKTDAALGAEATADGLQRLTNHWREKTRHHQHSRRNNFLLFSVVLALALAVLLLNQAGVIQSTLSHWCGGTPYCPSSWQQYWKKTAFSTNGSWVWALLSLKGFLLPVLGVAWLLRILSRQNAAHFALENDARQRLALLVSFVRLQELPETKLTEAERLLILKALFRPADGANDENPPPNAIELVSKIAKQ